MDGNKLLTEIPFEKFIKISNNHRTGKGIFRIIQAVAFAVNNLFKQKHSNVIKRMKRLTAEATLILTY